ncbi:MAG: DNA polymerase III subunit delta' [Phycisphaerae bacterium]|nr:DNA polymerase III subunit delta' [Phycisphaerae bacterium]
MRLSDIRHQERALSILRRALESGRTHHAYLFEGPDGVGKELAARALAARLLCQGAEQDQGAALFGAVDDADTADACGTCSSCHLFEAGNHPDFQLIDRALHKQHPDRAIRASKGLFLAVEVIRHFLIEPATLKPSVGPRRVFLVRGAERMNEAAQNALLKTLEEPPGNAVLILVSASAERLLPTIRSRCQRVPFGLLPPQFVADKLRELTTLSDRDAGALAELSGGRLGAALLWNNIGLLDTLNAVAPLVAAHRPHNPQPLATGLLQAADALAGRMLAVEANGDADEDESPTKSSSRGIPTDTQRAALKLVLMLVAAVYREALLTRVATAQRHLPTLNNVATRLAATLDDDTCATAIQAVAQTEQLIDRNVAAQLAAERLAIALG